jgi:hypothetical protein
MTDKAKKRIIPARPETSDAAAYMPRIPWRVVIFALLSLTTVIVGYRWKQARKADNLRASIVRVHQEELKPARDAVTALREKLERLIVSAAQAKTETLLDPKLHIPGLRSGHGLYLRLPSADAQSPEAIAKRARVMEPDLIAGCMGLSPTSARGLYEKGEFLMPPWIDHVKSLRDVMTLRVQDEVLSRRIRSDLPSVVGLARSSWFMLVLEEGDNRRDFPVRVFLWGLRDEHLLLRARVQSIGTLITTRILSKDAPASPKLSEEAKSRSGASDCSIASQLKSLTDAPSVAPVSDTPTPSATPTP